MNYYDKQQIKAKIVREKTSGETAAALALTKFRFRVPYMSARTTALALLELVAR